jgi:tRNA(Ile)-lysidine synthase
MTTSVAPRVATATVRASEPVLDAVRRAAPGTARLVLAVSGGLDSSVLLDAAARALDPSRLTVATFDHGTGPEARAAAAQVATRARDLGLRVECGRAESAAADEAGWRAQRWAFLRRVADGAEVITAHTRDDQVESVALRVLRGSGARGLAALAAPSRGVVRPFLHLKRADLERYAAVHGVAFTTDPSNASSRHARNRVRHDLLPALRRVRPSIDDELEAIGEAAAAWRAGLDALASSIARPAEGGGVRVARHHLAGYDASSLAVVWPAVAALAGVVLDRRGTSRLASFTRIARTGAHVPLSGGAVAVRERGGWWIGVAGDPAVVPPIDRQPLGETLTAGSWRFSCIASDDASDAAASGAWTATLPADATLEVRAWRDGDRLAGGPERPARRVKRWLTDAGIASPERRGWPVVLADGEIVWIPGVRRSDAASDRSGRPGLRYLCERNLR